VSQILAFNGGKEPGKNLPWYLVGQCPSISVEGLGIARNCSFHELYLGADSILALLSYSSFIFRTNSLGCLQYLYFLTSFISVICHFYFLLATIPYITYFRDKHFCILIHFISSSPSFHTVFISVLCSTPIFVQ
jgi:hypothetical protein